jgi:hypothetical protein
MSAYDNVFALLVSTLTASDWDDAKNRLDKLRAEDGRMADAYRDLAEALGRTMTDPEQWEDGDDAEGSGLIRYVEHLAADRAKALAEAAAELIAFCPDHGNRDTAFITCQCLAAEDLLSKGGAA